MLIIHISAIVVYAAVFIDSAVYLLSQKGRSAGGIPPEADLERVLFYIAVLCFSVLVFFFIRIIRRYHAEMRIHETLYRIVQNTAKVIAFQYDRSSDMMLYTYYNGRGELERHEYGDYLKGGGFRAALREDCAEAYQTAFGQMLEAPAMETEEFPMKITGDAVCWYRLAYQSLANDHGQVIGIVGSAIDVDDLVVARDVAREEAATDAMTGLLGKAAFAARASERLKSGKAAQVTLLMIDLDNFKEINDTMGHLEGDRIISAVAALLQREFSSDDLIGRFGGDEFVVFMAGISAEGTEKKLEHFHMRLAELWAEKPYAITCSVGACHADNGDGMTLDVLLQKADDAMYQVKYSGKKGFIIGGSCESARKVV
jgi:diguanylate cyclase (GGDEF)-like protein